MAVATQTFADRLAAEVERKRSQLVVGLDPNPDLLPVELRGDVARFCCGIVDAVAPHAVAVKPQLAFFEALGAAGIAAFEQVCQYSKRAGLLVIADGKRGDIGSTARAYSEAYIEGDPPLADALTVNPWLGRDAVEPFLGAVRRGGVGIFVLVRTSNAGGDLQDAVLKDGRPMWHHVAELVDEWGAEMAGEVGLSSVGAVVGATHPRAVAEARRLMPRSILLIPGVGAQGGQISDLGRAFQSGPASAIVPVSRSVIYAYRDAGSDYREAAGAEAARLKREIWTASGW
jgi:orotidine-5'-phosphate decarboxylase